jgi:alpha-tubulin suppressor-like RCC1 family protein
MRLRERTASLLCLALVLCAACGSGGYDVLVRLDRLDDEQRARVAAIEVAFIPSCGAVEGGEDPPSAMRKLRIDPEGGVEGLGGLTPGSYGLYARARDDNCQVLAAGCTTVQVKAGGSGTLIVSPSSLQGPNCAPPTSCREGFCRCVPDEERCNELDDDCDGSVDEGFDLQTDPEHCGACGQACALANASSECRSGECHIVQCREPFADCDGEAENGCEADLRRDPANCGRCGRSCRWACVERDCDEAVGVTAGGSHSCAWTEQGNAQCWGANDSGQLGRGTTGAPKSIPKPVGLDGHVTQLAAGQSHSCALLERGDVRCWGANESSQLATEGDYPRARPRRVRPLPPIRRIVAGYTRSCAITRQGVLLCWGGNDSHELATADLDVLPRPVKVTDVPQPVDGIALGSEHSCVRARGEVWCRGAGEKGQLGDGMLSARSTAVRALGLDQARAVAAGSGHSCAIAGAGGQTVSCWGDNLVGRLGTGHAENRNVPTSLERPEAEQLALGHFHSCALDTKDRVWCWGSNVSGALGVGDRRARNEPTRVTALEGRARGLATGGLHTCAVRKGRVLCWGDNGAGQLGIPGSGVRTVPAPVTRPR